MVNFSSLSSFAAGLFSQIPLGSWDASSHSAASHSSPAFFSSAPSCPIDGPLSCHNSTVTPDSCCFIYPGGQLLQTQFWDTSPAVGPVDSWTLHGLWPDLCDGTYPQFCNYAPTYGSITSIIEGAGQTELLEYMRTYWLPDRGSAEHFWEHEWRKHGTCINTLAPGCYGEDYREGDEVVDFFTRAVEIFKGLDTYKALADAGITPSYDRTYDADEIQAALSSISGGAVILGCRRGALNQAWYSFNVKGSVQNGRFVGVEPAGSGHGSCPRRGIRYLPKK